MGNIYKLQQVIVNHFRCVERLRGVCRALERPRWEHARHSLNASLSARGSFLLFCCAVLLATVARADHTPDEVWRLWEGGAEDHSFVDDLREGWVYQYGDSASIDDMVAEMSDDGWKAWHGDPTQADSISVHTWFLRRDLPDVSYPDPLLLLANANSDGLVVFLEGRAIYTSGLLNEEGRFHRPGVRMHWIPIPAGSGGRRLDIVFYQQQAGHFPIGSPVILYASQSQLIQHLLGGLWYKLALALLFLFVGVYVLFAHVVRRRYGLSLTPWLGFMAITLGISQLFSHNVMFMITDSAGGHYQVGLLAILLFPVGLWMYVEKSFGPGWMKLIRRCWQLQLIVCASIWIPDVLGWVRFGTAGQMLGNFALALQLLVGLGVGWREWVRGCSDRRPIALGVLLFSAAGLFDVARALLPVSSATELYPWGALALVLTLAYRQETIAGEAHRKLRRQAEALRRQQQHLEELVDERTQELRIATRAAESASRAKSEFLANMSHELRTPLNSILGYAQLMQRDTGLDDEHRERAGIIRSSGDHLRTLITDILDISKIEAGKIVLQYEELCLGSVVQGVADMVRPHAQEKKLDFHVEISERVPGIVSSDEKRLRQILLNLLGNAIKFTERGEVRLVVDCEDDCLIISVADSGAGIEVKYQEEIFQPFKQIEGATVQEGTGLGLAISRRIARKMGGELTVQSECGQGSVFTLTIPLVAQAAEEESPPDNKVVPQSPPPRVPPRAEFEALREAVRIGDIEQVLSELKRLELRCPHDSELFIILRGYAENFDINALQNSLG